MLPYHSFKLRQSIQYENITNRHMYKKFSIISVTIKIGKISYILKGVIELIFKIPGKLTSRNQVII